VEVKAMLQRNTSGSPLILPTLDPPLEVFPGDVIEHSELLAGFTEEPEAEEPKVKPKAKATAPADDDKEVTS
jgi:hypothetical protein